MLSTAVVPTNLGPFLESQSCWPSGSSACTTEALQRTRIVCACGPENTCTDASGKWQVVAKASASPS